MGFLSTIAPFIPIVLLVIVITAVLASGYVKSPPDVAYIISGFHKKPRVLIGKAGVKIPFFERLDKLSLGAIQIDVKTKSAVLPQNILMCVLILLFPFRLAVLMK